LGERDIDTDQLRLPRREKSRPGSPLETIRTARRKDEK
jgi:hypothetical protein